VPSPARQPVARDQPSAPATGFADRLVAQVQLRESQIVLGLDPDPMRLWPTTVSAQGTLAQDTEQVPAERAHGREPVAGDRFADASPAERAARAMRSHCTALIDAAGSACVAVKPQLARFEALGAPGWAALEDVTAHAHQAGLIVIADGKRGDIDVSARAYAQALIGASETPFGLVAGLGAEMVTVNPLMGTDALEPFVSAARASAAAVLVLVRTSNPGAADIEDLMLAGGERVWERIALLVNALGETHVGESGLSDVGAVVGATVPEHLARARELMPHAIFLLPGVGAQGGRVEDLAPAFAPGRAGGLISASRSIADAHRASGGDPAHAARVEAERLRTLAWELSGA
jgi:orotidine-5'-phosphate decarboxylase